MQFDWVRRKASLKDNISAKTWRKKGNEPGRYLKRGTFQVEERVKKKKMLEIGMYLVC